MSLCLFCIAPCPCIHLVSRDYLEDPERLSARGPIWACFLVRRRGSKAGVLVMPDRDGFIEWAAYLPEGRLA